MNNSNFPWERSEADLRDFTTASLRRALWGQPPRSLRAVSFFCDLASKRIRLKAHFERPYTDDEFDEIMAVEGEAIADFPDEFVVTTEFEIAPPGTPLHPLADGIVYLREGEAAS